jgi:hypothetical protein
VYSGITHFTLNSHRAARRAILLSLVVSTPELPADRAPGISDVMRHAPPGATSVRFSLRPLWFNRRPLSNFRLSIFNPGLASPLFSHSCAPLKKPPLCFHALTNPFSRSSFLLTSLQIPRGWGYPVFQSPPGLSAIRRGGRPHVLPTKARAGPVRVAERLAQTRMSRDRGSCLPASMGLPADIGLSRRS